MLTTVLIQMLNSRQNKTWSLKRKKKRVARKKKRVTKKDIESSSEKKRGKRKKLSLSRKEAPQIKDEDSDSCFSLQTKSLDDEELTLDCESHMDRIFTSGQCSLGGGATTQEVHVDEGKN